MTSRIDDCAANAARHPSSARRQGGPTRPNRVPAASRDGQKSEVRGDGGGGSQRPSRYMKTITCAQGRVKEMMKNAERLGPGKGIAHGRAPGIPVSRMPCAMKRTAVVPAGGPGGSWPAAGSIGARRSLPRGRTAPSPRRRRHPARAGAAREPGKVLAILIGILARIVAFVGFLLASIPLHPAQRCGDFPRSVSGPPASWRCGSSTSGVRGSCSS